MTRVLIVDDQQLNLYMLQVLLQGQGYEVTSARNGIEALDLARREPPDLIITDILMPGMDGFRLCREWVADERLRHVPLVFYTATYTDPRDEAFALGLGAARFIVKPTEPDAFVDILRQVLQNHVAHRLLPPGEPEPTAEAYFEQYNQALIRKLEDKMVQLEEANRALELDIAARKRTEAALRASEERHRLIADHVSDVVWQMDPQMRFTYVSPAVEGVLGYTPDEVIGLLVTTLLDEDGLAQLEQVVQSRLAGERRPSTDPTMYRMKHKNGQWVAVEVVSSPISDPAGHPTGFVGVTRDITARLRSEEALRTSEERFRLISTVASDYMFSTRLDENGELALNWVAGAFEDITGYTFEEYVARGGWRATIYPDDLSVDDRDMEKLRANQPVITEIRTLTKSGDVTWVRVYAQPVWDAVRQELVGIYGAVQNITKRKLAELALQQRASQLALLNEIGGQVTALLDLDQVLERTAQLIQQRFGFHHVGLFTRDVEPDRLVMKARAGEFARLFPPDHSIALGQGMVGHVGLHGDTLLANDVTAEPRYINPYPDRLPTRSELSVPIRIGDEIVGVLDLQGAQPDAFGSDDVTTLETLAGQIAVAINNARLYTQAAQHNRELTLLNRAIAATAVAGDGLQAAMSAVCRELALAFDVPQVTAALFDREKAEANVVAECLAPGRPSALGKRLPMAGSAEFQRLLAHKTALAIEHTGSDSRLVPIHNLVRRRGAISLLLLPLIADEHVVGCLVVDPIEPRTFSAGELTLIQRVAEQVSAALARAHLEQERQMLQEQFHQAQKMEAVGRLAGGVAHDFNNLLTVIRLSTQVLQRTLHDQDPLWPQVRSIHDASERAINLTRQLLAFSRREIIAPQVLDLNQVLGELDKLLLRRLIGEDIELVTLPAPDLWPVQIDPTQIEQVVVNLAVNARDAMPVGGKLVIETANVVLDEAYATHHLGARPGEYVRLVIRDNGVGMSDEVKAHLFEPFFTTKERDRGTGLGLATVFGIVRQNRGYIEVDSATGHGTTFTIYLPRVAPPPPATSQPPTAPTRPPSRGSETLLLVEDDARVRELTRDILAAQGYRVLTAKDGIEALQVAHDHQGPIHLLLADVVMPRLSGRALADQLRASHPEMQTLFISGYADDAIVHHGVLDQGVHFLSKPYGLETLIGKVRNLLDSAI